MTTLVSTEGSTARDSPLSGEPMIARTDLNEENKVVMPDPGEGDGENALGAAAALLQAKEVTIRTPSGNAVLTDISFHVEPGELVAVAGLSRAGASALLKSLAGIWAPASGEFLIDGVSLYAHLRAFSPWIGYVPSQFEVSPHLTAQEVLQDAAWLRLPRRTSSQDRKQRLQSVLETVGLWEVRDRRVSQLSAIEKRRLHIAVELIAYPKLLLLDEPDEPITPFDEVQIMILLRDLSRQGTTVLLINPRCRSIGLADKVLYLAPGGFLAWFGPADETLGYLKSYLPRGVVKDMFGLQEALEMLVNPQTEDGSAWAKRFRDHEAYGKYIDDPLNNRFPDLLLQTRPLLRIRLRNSAKEKLPPPMVPRAGGIRKFFLLVKRSFRLLWRERTWLAMLALPPVVTLSYLLFSSLRAASPSGSLPAAGLPSFLMILTAGMLVQHEIWKEREVYRRESRVTPMLVSYVMSKVWWVVLLAVYQGLLWSLASGLQAGLPMLMQLSLVAFSGGILGLLVSALSRTAMSHSWVLFLTVPLLWFAIDPTGGWSTLIFISLFLILLLMGAQWVATRASA
jgi:ABC-type multidrug transport system ATPase subunit